MGAVAFATLRFFQYQLNFHHRLLAVLLAVASM